MTESTPKLVLCDFRSDTGDPRWPSFSPFVIEVECALRVAQLPFEHRHISVFQIRKLNPLGQLPVLLIGDEVVCDSTLILYCIDEQLAPGRLTRGLDRRGVAEAWLWEEFADTALYPQVIATRWADARGQPVALEAFFGAVPPMMGAALRPMRPVVAGLIRRRMLAALAGRDFIRAGFAACEARLFRVLDHLEACAPERGFWLGAAPSVADIGLFAHLHVMRLPHTAFRAQDIARRVKLSRWLDRVEAARGVASA